MKRWKHWCVFLRDLYFRKKQPSFMLGSRTESLFHWKRHHTFFYFTQWKTNNDMVFQRRRCRLWLMGLISQQSWLWICRNVGRNYSLFCLNSAVEWIVSVLHRPCKLDAGVTARKLPSLARHTYPPIKLVCQRTLWTFDKRMSRTFPKGELGIYSFFLGYHATIAESNKS